MIEDFHFLRPWLLLALALPAAVLWMSTRASDLRSRWKSLIAPHLLESLVIEPAGPSRIKPAWLLVAVLVLACIGAAGPTWQREAPPFVEDTAPLVVAVDLSATMDAIDVTPSRLERAKLKLKDIVAARPGARTALVAYAGTAHQVLPLTDDAALLGVYGDALATGIMPVAGKDTAAALEASREALSHETVSGTVVFLTDGVERKALEPFRDLGDTSVVVLGIGTAQGGPVKTADGGFLADASGSRVFSKLDVEGLKNLGSLSGVDVATMTDDDADVRWVVDRVATSYASKSADLGDRWKDMGWYLVVPAATLLASSFRRGWVVKFAALVLAVGASLASPQAQASWFEDMWLTPDQQGRLAFKRGDFASAADHFRDPMWRGVALYRAGKFAEAIDAFATVDTPESWFDQGNALLQLGKFEEAVSAYQKALEKRKEWPDAKANLAIAERLLAEQKKDEEEQAQDPNMKPDEVQFDDKGKKGKAGQVDVAEQTSEMWMQNIQVSPAQLMARKFAIEAGGSNQ